MRYFNSANATLHHTAPQSHRFRRRPPLHALPAHLHKRAASLSVAPQWCSALAADTPRTPPPRLRTPLVVARAAHAAAATLARRTPASCRSLRRSETHCGRTALPSPAWFTRDWPARAARSPALRTALPAPRSSSPHPPPPAAIPDRPTPASPLPPWAANCAYRWSPSSPPAPR